MKVKIHHCKECDKEYTKFKSTDKYCSQKCQVKAENEKEKQKRIKARNKKIKWPKARLDSIFAKYIRLRDNNTCIVCGSQESPNNGHFIARICTKLRFDETNCNCQCSSCNGIHESNPVPYTNAMIGRYGKEVVDQLSIDWFSGPVKLNRLWYENKIAYYKEKIEEMEYVNKPL